MFRPQNSSRTNTSNSSGSGSSNNLTNNKQNSSKTDSTHSTTTSTIREIRSRTVNSATANNAKQLLANRRQAMSMERLNSNSSSSTTTTTSQPLSDKESGSTTSLNGSTTSSPSRNSTSGGLNRTASRVSRFRSAKAVFERLSSANTFTSSNPTNKTERHQPPEKSRGTVASRYAAAAAARATAAAGSTSLTNASSNLPNSPRSRIAQSSRAHDIYNRHNVPNNDSKSPSSPKHETNSQPKPQPRVLTPKRSAPNHNGTDSHASRPAQKSPVSSTKPSIRAKPPPKDLIDKIVLEIAQDATNKPGENANCTIQDLSNCDISGIPETLDFDRCFQDVEMMTEEEARKLLSRKSEKLSSTQIEDIPDGKDSAQMKPLQCFKETNAQVISPSDNSQLTPSLSNTNQQDASINSTLKCKVRFSEDPVQIFDTHAVEEYDRRNDDIDPVAASAEYEIEKSKERQGIKDDSEDEFSAPEACSGAKDPGLYGRDINVTTGIGHQQDRPVNYAGDNGPGDPQEPDNAPPHNETLGLCANTTGSSARSGKDADYDDKQAERDEYIKSLEREVNLKLILEQNLRDLQSQYYEAVKELDEYKSVSETKVSKLEQDLSNSCSKLDSVLAELGDTKEKFIKCEKELNENKESSQLLEKKYHRAKRVIKDMQSREESFNRREQLYQQKLDEIEHELGVLINCIDKTVFDDGLKYYGLTDGSNCHWQHQAQLDAFGLIKQMLSNFNADQSTQNPQIKQRVVSILEQQLAALLTQVSASVTGPVQSLNPMTRGIVTASLNQPKERPASQSFALTSHRLSQPNLPHPIGVGGQPTKVFHGINPVQPLTVPHNEPSPPQSVNSYPSSNSLNSLNNNNNNNDNHHNNNLVSAKLLEQPMNDLQTSLPSSTAKLDDDKSKMVVDTQVPYQTNEWHDKPVSEWTTNQVSTWLLALGLDQYISKFEDRNVNGQSLINLDSTVLKGLGVLNSNDRNLLKKKIRELRVEMEKERKLMEKKLKENLKDRSKLQTANTQGNKTSWKKSLLS